MEMLVTKFSKGKYRNEGELFNEPISNENVKLMGEMIALQALRTVKKYDMKIADKLYIGLIKDLHHMNEIDYIVSDGYDVAQTAICFLYQYGSASEIYGKDRKGKEISIKLACYREVDHFINLLRNRPDRRGTVVESIDFTDYKALPMDPVNCFEHEQTDYSKYDELVGHCNFCFGTRYPELLYERHEASRSLRRTRYRQRYNQPPQGKHPSEILQSLRLYLICNLTSYPLERQSLYRDCLFSCYRSFKISRQTAFTAFPYRFRQLIVRQINGRSTGISEP